MDRFDHLVLRCPRLGGEVTFAYCRREQGNLPCRMALRCWQGLIPVEEYLRTFLTDEQWEHCFNAPLRDKLSSILEIADAAQKRKEM